MSACSAYACINRPSMRKPGLTFHSFPKDEKRRNKWLKAICRENWTPARNNKVCSEHFPEEMIDRTSLSCVRLKENAVPRSVLEDNSSMQDVNKINEKTLNDALHKNAESASLIIQELFSIESQSSENEFEPGNLKVKTASTPLAIQNSVCITKKTSSGVKCKTKSISSSAAFQNIASISLDTPNRRKTSASVAGQNSVSGAINEIEELELIETSACTQGQNAVSVAPIANKLSIQRLQKNVTPASRDVQNSSSAPNINNITHLIDLIKCSSGNAAKIVVIEGIKSKESAQKRKIAKLKKALKAERKKVKTLKDKLKIFQNTLSNVTDLLNDIKNQRADEQR